MTPNESNRLSANSPHPIRGYFYIAAAAFFWAATAALGKAVFTGRLAAGSESAAAIDPLILSQTRTTFSVMALIPILLLRGGRQALAMGRGDLLRCLVLGTLGIAGSNFFYYYAIEKTTVATAIILQYTAPAWVLLYMLARHQQRPSLMRVAGVGLAVVGCALAIDVLGEGRLKLNPLGVAAAFGAAFSFAFYNVFGHKLLQRQNRWKVVTYALLGASLLWIVLNPPWKVLAAGYTRDQWIFLVIFAAISMLIPFSLYFSGLQYLDATRAVVTSCLEPVFAILLAVTFVGEPLQLVQVVGVVVVLLATVLVQRPDR
ncbi:MAG: DMT family transporter [Acidobacteria bacterium]|nr:DMT family transporter [Acidobacteriota bacterium]